MRVYIFTNIPGKEDIIEEAFEGINANILVKETAGNQERIYATIEEVMQRSDEEKLALVLVSDPVGASIYLNKVNGVRAAMCQSKGEVESAVANNANVYIFGQNYDLGQLAEAVASHISSGFNVSNIFKRKGKREFKAIINEVNSVSNSVSSAGGYKEKRSDTADKQVVTAEKPRQIEKEISKSQTEHEDIAHIDVKEEGKDDVKYKGRDKSSKKGFFNSIKESLGFEGGE